MFSMTEPHGRFAARVRGQEPDSHGGAMERIGLAETIAAVRQELTTSIEEAQGADIRFQVGEVMLELEVEVQRVSGKKGGLKVWVLEAGGEKSRSDSHTHRLSVPITPVSADGTPLLTGDTVIPD
ncbi:trypco2 family protein [Streptomyces sp. NPDC085596]|uniref:trypco2 family protein n=1 Tax=Streptomyces sp. NPDC085596 TaxID=3365731 RepID=UPI0037D37A3D